MRLIPRKDSQGRTVGYDAVDEYGNQITGRNYPDYAENRNVRPVLPGQSLPTGEADLRTAAQIRAAESSEGGESGSVDEDGIFVPPNLATAGGGESPSTEDGDTPGEGLLVEREAQGTYGPAFTQNRVYNFNKNEDANLATQRTYGGLSGFGAAFQQTGRNVARGVADFAEDLTDFGAAVIDTALGREVNDADNFFNPSARISDPTSIAGNLAKEGTSFAVSLALTGGVASLGAAKAIPGFAALNSLKSSGVAGRIGYGAVTGFITDFVKAKEGEANIFKAVEGTPVETAVSRFLATDTDEDANLWLNKFKEGISGIPLGIAFDLLGEGAQIAMRNWRVNPAATYLDGVRKAKMAPEGQQEQLMLAAAKETTEQIEETQLLLKAAIEDDATGRITDARRLLAAASEDDAVKAGFINIEIEPAPITARGDVAADWDVRKLSLLEEEMLKLEDLRTALNGLEAPTEVSSKPLSDVDESIFEMQDEIDRIVNAVASPKRQIGIDRTADLDRQATLRSQLSDLDVEIEAAKAPRTQPTTATYIQESEVYESSVKADFDEYKKLGGAGEQPEDFQTLRFEESFGFEPEIVEVNGTPKNSSRPYLQRVESEDALVDSPFKLVTPSNTDDSASKLLELETRRADLETELFSSNISFEPGSSTPDSAVLDAPFQSTPTREPNIVGGEGVGRVEGINDDLLEPTPSRTPNVIGGEGVGRQEVVGDPTARKLQNNPELGRAPERPPAVYRSKPEIRRDVANKAVETRVRTQRASVPAKGTKRTAKDLGIDVDALNKKFIGVQSGESTGRFLNLDKLTDSEDIAELVDKSMSTISDFNLKDSISNDVAVFNADKFTAKFLGLDSVEERDALLLAYSKDTSNLQSANIAVRKITVEYGEQVLEAAKLIPTGKKLADLTTAEMTAQADLIFKMEQFDKYLTFNKNLGKLTAQGLQARGVKLDPASLKRALSRAEYNSIFKKATTATDSTPSLKDEMLKMLKTPEGRKKFEMITNDISRGATPEEVAQAMKVSKFMVFGKNAGQLIRGVRMSDILSGTRSNLTNVVSNATMTIYSPATQISGAVLDMPVQWLRGNKAAVQVDKQVMNEAIGALGSLHQYLGDSFRLARAAHKQGKGILGENLRQIELLEQGLDLLNPEAGPALNWLAKAQSYPLRLLVTGDEFFKQLNYRSNIHGKAWEEGLSRGYTGKRLKDFVSGVVDDSLLVDEVSGLKGLGRDPDSLEYAEFVSFQTKITSDNSRIRKGFVDIVDKIQNYPIPGLHTFSSMFVPFVKTPSNIMAYTARNTPLAVVSKGWQADLAAGGARAARAKGEYALGTAALSGIVMLAMQGKLIGAAPKDPAERALFYAEGKQPYSIKLTDKKTISFQRMEPFAGHFGIVADLAEATSRAKEEDKGELDKLWGAVTIAFVGAVKNRTFFEGVSDMTALIDVFGEDTDKASRKISDTASKIATTLIPYSSLLNEIRKTTDNTLRETKTLVDQFRNKIPGLSQSLPAQRFWLTGEPVKYSSSPILNLYPTSNIKKDPLIEGMMRYNAALTPPTDKIKGVELSPEQYSQYLGLVGQIELDEFNGKTLYESLLEAYNSYDKSFLESERSYLLEHDEYARKSGLAVELNKIKLIYQNAAQTVITNQYPELYDKIKTKLYEDNKQKENLHFMNEPLYQEFGYQLEEEPQVSSGLEEARSKTNRALEALTTGSGPIRTEDFQ